RKIDGARKIWAQHDPAGPATPVASYLRARGIRIALPPTIAYGEIDHPYLKRAGRFPAMLAPVQNGERKIVGVHCTFLANGRPGWTKMPAPVNWPVAEGWKSKIMRGQCWGGAVRLTQLEDVVVLAE